MDLRINRCKKYITWNIISLLGYAGVVFAVVFLFMFWIASSGIGVSSDVSEFFYIYIVKYLVLPYIGLYKFQLFLVGVMLLLSVYENSYYISKEQFGLRLFGNNEKVYSIVFVTGVCLNILPMYVFFIYVVSNLMKLL
ncbi:hypothetical protein IKL64_02215 [bacterium]|nr:hypothetical protein [bacterium]